MSERAKRNIFIAIILLVPVYVLWTPTDAYADTLFSGSGMVVADGLANSFLEWVLELVCSLIEFILNLICTLLDFVVRLLFGGDINDIIKQVSSYTVSFNSEDVGLEFLNVETNEYEALVVDSDRLNLFAFNFEYGNPYGLIAAIGYSFIRLYAFAFLPINFTISLVKAIINGGSSRAFEEVKSSFYDMIIKILLLVLMPYIFDMLITLRTSFMTTAYETFAGAFSESSDETIIDAITNGASVFEQMQFTVDAVNSNMSSGSITSTSGLGVIGLVVSFIIRIATYVFTLYLMIIYFLLSISTSLLFIAFPMICVRGKNFKNNLSKWFETAIGIYVTPLIDLICICIPTMLNNILFSDEIANTITYASLASPIILLLSLWFIIPLRGQLRQFAGISDTGADQLGMQGIRQVATLAFGAARLMGNKNNANAEADEADRKADEASELANENERYESAQNARAAEEVEAQVGDGTGIEGSDANGITDKDRSKQSSSGSGVGIPETGGNGTKNDGVKTGDVNDTKTGDGSADNISDVLSDTSVTDETSDVGSETSDVSGGTDSKSSDSKYSDLKNTDRELAKRDAELAEKARDTENDYNRRINEAQESAAQEDSLAEDAETTGDIQGAEEHRNNANSYRQGAETLEGQKQAELDSIESERSGIAQERQSTSSAGLAERDAELAEQEKQVKSNYDAQISEEEQAAAEEDAKADAYEAEGNMQDAKECRDNAEQHRSNARDLNSKEQQELTDIENERKDIERRRNAIREQSTGAELDERDAEVAEQMDKTGAEYDAKIASEEKAASAETQMADEANNAEDAQTHRDSAAQHTANAENLRQAKEDALAPMQQERDDIAAQKQANARTTSRGGYSGQSDTSGGDHPQTISEAREMLNQADAESKRTADTFRAMDDQLASRDAELNQQMQKIKTEYGGKQAEEARLSAEAKRQAAEIKATNQSADVSGLNAEAARHDEARATLQKQEKEALAPLETERSSIKAQREALKAGISEQNARQKEIAAKQKDLAAKQKSVANATGAAYSEDALEAEHQANMANIKQRYMSLDDFDKNGNLDNLTYGQQAELYRQRANQIRANENSRKRKAAVGAVVGGAGMAMYGPTLSVGAGIAGASMGSGIANKKGNAMMNQTLEQREHEMQGMAGNMQMASSDVTSRSRSVGDVKSAIDNSSMSGAEKRQAKRTVNAMEDTYGAGVRMEMSDEHRDTRVPLRRRENVVPFARTMAGPGANLSAPPVNVSSISSEAGSAYDRIGQELNGRKAGRYATAPADSSNVMGKLRSIYERRPQPEVPVPDIDVDIPKPRGDVSTEYLYTKFNNPSKNNKGEDIKSANDLLLSVGRLSSSDDVALGDFEHRCSVCGCESLTSGALGKNNPGSSKTWQGVAMHDLNTAISSLCTNPATSKILIDASDILMGESRESAYQFFDVGVGKEAGDILWSKVEKSSSGYASGLTKEGVLRYLASFFGTAQER